MARQQAISTVAAARARRGRNVFAATVAITRAQMRQTWRLLAIIGVALALTSTLICAVPPFSQVIQTAGVRNALLASPNGALVFVSAQPRYISGATLQQAKTSLDGDVQDSIGPYLTSYQETFLQIVGLPVMPYRPTSNPNELPHTDTVTLVGAAPDQAARHMTVRAGSLPTAPTAQTAGATPDTLDIAVTPETAAALNAQVGALIPVQLQYFAPALVKRTLTLRIVGLFSLPNGDAPFWSAAAFRPYQQSMSSGGGGQPTTQPGCTCSAYVPYASLLSLLDAEIKTQPPDPFTHLAPTALQLSPQPIQTTLYQLDDLRITRDNLDDVINQMDTLVSDIGNDFFYKYNATVSGSAVGGKSTLVQYRDQSSVPTIPVTIFLLEVVGLVLLFITLLANLLVERQAEAIAVLRSRGARRSQLLGAFLLQCVALGLCALVIGPALAATVAGALARRALAPGDQVVIQSALRNPTQVALGVSSYAVALVVVALAALALAFVSASRMQAVSARRETSRATRSPLWQRLSLDLVLGVFALLAFAGWTYIAHSGSFDPQTASQLSPLGLVAPLLLLIACALLFLRLFSLALRGALALAARGRGGAPMLAFAQLARAPAAASRVTLLLTLTTAFVIFTQVFVASQTQRIQDVAAYQVGADISGGLRSAPSDIKTPEINDQLLEQKAAPYRAVAGVTSVSLGALTQSFSPTSNASVQIEAVDTATFAQTARWPSSASAASLPSLMSDLRRSRDQALAERVVPAVVDDNLWNRLRLHQGAIFALGDQNASDATTGSTLQFRVVARVHHLPPLADATDAQPSLDFVSAGMLVDVETYAGVTAKLYPDRAIELGYIWLRTRDDAASLASVRRALTTGALQLETFQDRRAIIAGLQRDPLYLDLSGALTICAALTVALALVGALLATWASARSRVTTFAALRALGAEPAQVARVALWEQGSVYGAGLALGVALGAFLAWVSVPTLVFTGAAAGSESADQISAAEFFARQSAPDVRVIAPAALVFTLIGVIALCAVAVTLMTTAVTRPALGQALRLNDD